MRTEKCQTTEINKKYVGFNKRNVGKLLQQSNKINVTSKFSSEKYIENPYNSFPPKRKKGGKKRFFERKATPISSVMVFVN